MGDVGPLFDSPSPLSSPLPITHFERVFGTNHITCIFPTGELCFEKYLLLSVEEAMLILNTHFKVLHLNPRFKALSQRYHGKPETHHRGIPIDKIAQMAVSGELKALQDHNDLEALKPIPIPLKLRSIKRKMESGLLREEWS